jgi:glycosyltransferase involved in cell wall biosynthesis
MRILYHHRIRSKDGQYVHIEEMVGALRALGHEVIVVGPAAVEKEAFGAEAGVTSILKRFLPKFFYELMEFAYAYRAYARLDRAVRTHRPDCLYERYNLFLPAGVWIKRKFRLPMLLEVNAPICAEREKYGGIALPRLARWSERYAWSGADYVLPVTNVLAQIIERSGVPKERIVVIPNGIDPERFSGALCCLEAKKSHGLEGRIVLGFTGFVREWHCLERVIDVLARDRGVPRHLLIVGDGPARPGLERYANALGVSHQVTITGIVPREAIARYIAAFDVALQPAATGYASPLKLFEYMAMGRAIVAPAQANIQEVLQDGANAVLFDPNDPAALISAIDRVCEGAELRQRIAQGAKESIGALGLTWKNNAERVNELFVRLEVKRDLSAEPSQRTAPCGVDQPQQTISFKSAKR